MRYDQQALQGFMEESFGAIVRPKKVPEMILVAEGFGLAQNLGIAGLPGRDEFLDRFSTTLGPIIYLAEDVMKDPLSFAIVLTHECTHVTQWRADKIVMPWLYATWGERRSSLEADAYAAGLAIQHQLTGQCPTTMEHIEAAVASLKTSYMLRGEDVDLARGKMMAHAVAIKNGLINVKTAQVASAWFRENAS